MATALLLLEEARRIVLGGIGVVAPSAGDEMVLRVEEFGRSRREVDSAALASIYVHMREEKRERVRLFCLSNVAKNMRLSHSPCQELLLTAIYLLNLPHLDWLLEVAVML